MKTTLYTIYVSGERKPYQVYAFDIREAILILKGRLISMDYCSEIVRDEYLTICYYNLKEKYLRGQKDFTDEVWNKLDKFYKEALNYNEKL